MKIFLTLMTLMLAASASAAPLTDEACSMTSSPAKALIANKYRYSIIDFSPDDTGILEGTLLPQSTGVFVDNREVDNFPDGLRVATVTAHPLGQHKLCVELDFTAASKTEGVVQIKKAYLMTEGATEIASASDSRKIILHFKKASELD